MFGELLSKLEPSFSEILVRSLDGEELSVKEGERLLNAKGLELHALTLVADEVRRRTVGDIVTYVVNRNINFTNICISDCKFCAFRRSPGDADAYVLKLEQIEDKTREALEFGATEVCLQGGLHPDFGLDNYIDMLEAVRKVSSKIHIHAFSPAELNHIAEREDMEMTEVIKALRDAGLNSVPGTAAEILVDRVRDIICPKKLNSNEWVAVIRSCHELGLPTTATMMYGHVETPLERVKHMEILREIQRETHGFTEFVPLSFMPHNTSLQRERIATDTSTGADDIRVHAVARLMLTGYIDNVQASWVKLGPKLAQVMLGAGANDISGTLMEENISRAAGAREQSMLPRQLEQLILDMGRVPRQRTTTYGIPLHRSACTSIA